jgi:hypothetical protein
LNGHGFDYDYNKRIKYWISNDNNNPILARSTGETGEKTIMLKNTTTAKQTVYLKSSTEYTVTSFVWPNSQDQAQVRIYVEYVPINTEEPIEVSITET